MTEPSIRTQNERRAAGVESRRKPVFTETMQIGINLAYLGTQRDLGVILEVINGLPEGKHMPDAT